MTYQAYTEMLHSSRIKEREKVSWRLLKKKILERKGDKQKTIAIEYRKNNDKQENLHNTYTIWQADNK